VRRRPGDLSPEWLRTRDAVRNYLLRGESVNLIVGGNARWRPLIQDLRRQPELAELGEVGLDHIEAMARRGLVREILARCGSTGPVPDKPYDLIELGRVLKARPAATCLALTSFDLVRHRSDYELDLFLALRELVTDARRLVLLIQSRSPFAALLPQDHPLSSLDAIFQTIELRGRS
jgi:hypothetical protein